VQEHPRASGPCRGFGSEVRLRSRGGPFELPETPGPAAYEVPRHHDLLPQWVPSTIMPWGRRTSGRPELKFATASDVGPGEYTAHHGMHMPYMQCTPAPLFGQPLKGLAKDSLHFPGPGAYALPSSVRTKSGFSMGKGKRPAMTRDTGCPGPGTYAPDFSSAVADSFCASFGVAERSSPGEGVDPDEPPGPGSHQVRQEMAHSCPNAGMPREQKLKKSPGMGPGAAVPGPGIYPIPSTLDKKASGLGKPLKRPTDNNPGPGEYDPSFTHTHESSQEWKSLQRTGPRGEASSARDQVDKQIERVTAMLKADGNAPKKKPEVNRFSPGGPKYSMMGKRPLQAGGGVGPKPKSENHHGMVGGFS